MPESFEISASTGSYPVTVGNQPFVAAADRKSPTRLISSTATSNRGYRPASPSGLWIEAIEANKSLEFAPHMIKEFAETWARDRSSHLFAIGGGIIQDVDGTFRGIDLYARAYPGPILPTTLLSMVDSCIGRQVHRSMPQDTRISSAIFFPSEQCPGRRLLYSRPSTPR